MKSDVKADARFLTEHGRSSAGVEFNFYCLELLLQSCWVGKNCGTQNHGASESHTTLKNPQSCIVTGNT